MPGSGPPSLGAVEGGFVNEQRNLVAVDARDDLGPPGDARNGRQVAKHLGIHRIHRRFIRDKVLEKFRMGRIRTDANRQLAQVAVSPRGLHDFDQSRVGARIGFKGQVRVA